MKKRNLQNKELDEIGRKLLKAGSLQNGELERIVAAPHLFDAVKRRIRAGQEREPEGFWASGPSFSFLARQSAGAALAGLFIVVMAIWGLLFLAKQTAPTQITSVAALPDTAEKDARPLPVIAAAGPEDKATAFKNTAFVYRDTAAKNKTVLKANFTGRTRPPRESAGIEAGGEFYPVTFTGNSEEMSSGAQVIRVELPRSSLFAMGVDLPDENRAGTVKADLLISADGVTRGFRLVR
jgi:hypothetical protein